MLLCVLNVCVCVLFHEFYVSNGYTNKKGASEREIRALFPCEWIQIESGYLCTSICVLVFTWLLAAVCVGSVAFSIT